MPYAIDLRNLPIGTDGVLPEAVPQDKRDLRTVGALTPERQALEDRLYEQQGLVTRPIEREQPQEEKKEQSEESSKVEKKAIDDKTTQTTSKKASAQQKSPAKQEEVLLGSELPTFEQTLEAAKKGEPKALRMLNAAAKVGGFSGGIEVTKDGIFYTDDKGKRVAADMETAKTLYDRTATSAIYINRWRQKLLEKMQGQQSKPSRQAIATEYDPAVLNALRTDALLGDSPSGLISYLKMPYDIENTAARTDYTRAGMALRQAKGSPEQQMKWVRQEDGSYLVEDSRTAQPLYATDVKGNKMPPEYAGRLDAWSDELVQRRKQIDEGESVHWNEQIGYYVVKKNGEFEAWDDYLREKHGGDQPTGTAAKKKNKTATEPKQEAVKTNPVAYNNIGTLRLDDR